MEQEYTRRNQQSSDIIEGYLTALFDFYVSGYYLDLKREKYYAIGQMQEYYAKYNAEDDWIRMDDYIRECINEEDQSLITEVSRIGYIREHLKKEKSYSVEVRDHGTGKERWYRFTVMRCVDEDHAAIVFTDVTNQVLQRQEMERLTQSVQEELELNQTLGIYSWRIIVDEKNTMRYIDWSENACKFMGIPAKPGQHASMRTLYNIIHPDLLPAFIMELQKTVTDASGNYVFEFDNKQEMNDGTVKWFHCSGRMITLPNGTERAIVGAFRDVTDSYLIKEEQQELTEVRDLMQAARWTAQFNYDGTISSVKFSDEVRRSLGYENEEDFPNNMEFWKSIMHPEDIRVRDEVMAAAVADPTGKTQYDVKYRLKKKDGEYLWVRSAIRIHRDEVGNAESAIGVFVDINDSVLRQQAEENLRQANEEQNAQLEEITALNAQLEENQTKLEEAASEQEAQIEEINTLNIELTEQKENLEKHYDAIRSLSKLYYASYYVDVDNDDYYELLSNDEIKDKYAAFGPKGKSQAALNWTCENRIAPEYREEARAFMDYSTLSERMQNTEVVSIRVQLVTGDWSRLRFIAGTRHEDGRLKSCIFAVRNVNDEVEEEHKRNAELQQALTLAQNSAAEQEAQIEEITALNGQLEKNQAELEASVAEIEEERAKVSEAYGMIEGFSSEYHTIWVVDKDTSRMRLIRSNGQSTIKRAVQMGIDEPLFDPAVVTYVNSCVEPEDRERMLREISFAEVMRQLQEKPRNIYAVNYLRRDDSGHVGYHQIAFANADTRDGKKQFVYGFRDVDQLVKEEQKQKEELQAALNRAREAADEQAAQMEEITALNAQLQENQTKLEEAAAEQEAQFEQIQALNKALKETQDNAIKDLLAEFVRHQEGELADRLMKVVGQYFGADRSYIFETSEDAKLSVNTYEWCAEGVVPEIQNLQKVPISTVEPWNIEFRKSGCFYLSCDDEYAKEDPIMYEVLEPQGISALMAAPIIVEGKIIGFLGVDNPKENIEHKLFLSVAASMVYHEIRIKRDRIKEEKYQKELEIAKEGADAANAAKTTFLFNMSHDIRTPMNAIIGYANLMKRNQGSMEKWPGYLEKILQSSDFLLGLINNVLEMARIESGKSVLDEDVYSVDAFTDNLYSVFAVEMEKKDIRFTKSVDVRHQYLYLDDVKLREIYLNILSNAQKYTFSGGSVDLSVKELPSDKDGYALIQTTVADTGIGISEEFMPYIFEEFTREKNSSGNRIQGTGLGMPIVKKLVELMGGTIEVKSKVGVGSTFIVTIPHRIAERTNETAKEETIDYSHLVGKRILLAEDNDLNAEIATEILSEFGFEIERAVDGAVCVDMLSRAEDGYYDLILMDIQMPNLDGYGAAKAIRALNDLRKADIPIIAMTANAFEEDKQNAIDAGMNGHVAKPIEIPVLMRTLAYVFREYSAI